jgi:thioredoxin reductase (NADPH)
MNKDIRDVIMIGAGPSALAAAIYTTREDIDTILYEKSAIGGLAAITDIVDNYPGFPDGIEGLTLAGYLEKQAERFGAHIDFGDVSAIRDEDGIKVVTVDGADVRAKSVLIATGSDYKKIGVPGEKEFYGRGVHYCATCDGAYYRDKKLAVVGGGNSALQETLFLTRYASHIDLLVRSTIKASEVLQKDLQKFVDEGKVTIHLNTTTEEIIATDGRVSAVNVIKNGEALTIDIDGIFVFVGLMPNTGFLKDSPVELDEIGLIKTDTKLETSMPGVFASGDVRSGATAQIASAVGEGATAALSIREYLDELNRHHAA